MLGWRPLFLAFITTVALVSTQASAWATPLLRDIITPHRAVYQIKLARTEDGSGVSSASGRMVFEVTGSACEGYAMRQRMVVNIGDEEGNLGRLDFRISTFESALGDHYSFDSKTTVNDETIEAEEGEARRHGSSIEVTLKQPAEKTVMLDGKALFPSQHLQAIIEAARAERRFLSVDVYEGAGSGESSDAAAAAIGRATRTREDDMLGGGLRQWPVSIGYYDAAKADEHGGEELPIYQMSFLLYENGVTSQLLLDYGDYALAASLEDVEPLAGPEC